MSETNTESALKNLLDPANFPQVLLSPDQNVHVELRYEPLDQIFASKFIRSRSAGANVIFLGTTRDNFDNRPVSHLSYEAYPQLALRTLSKIASEVALKHKLHKTIIVHRLGEVPIAEESIIVGVSSGHRGECWQGAEELLERVKERAEIWKREWFVPRDGDDRSAEAVWKSNKDSDEYGQHT